MTETRIAMIINKYPDQELDTPGGVFEEEDSRPVGMSNFKECACYRLCPDTQGQGFWLPAIQDRQMGA